MMICFNPHSTDRLNERDINCKIPDDGASFNPHSTDRLNERLSKLVLTMDDLAFQSTSSCKAG